MSSFINTKINDQINKRREDFLFRRILRNTILGIPNIDRPHHLSHSSVVYNVD